MRASLMIQFCGVLGLSWILWRLWRFSIIPLLLPNKPKTLPYFIPFVGHAASFFRDGDGTVTRGRRYFNNDRRPFKLVIMGETVYVITSPHDTALVHKQVENMSMDSWIQDLMTQFGAARSSIQAMWTQSPDPVAGDYDKDFMKALQNASTEPLAHLCQLLFRLQLNPGDFSNQVQECLLTNIHERMKWDMMPPDMIFAERDDHRLISLMKWSQNVLLEGATTAFFGKSLLQVEPDLFAHFFAFDESSWKLSYRIPPLWAQDMLKAKSFTQDAMWRYFDQPAARRADASWLVQAIETRMRASGIPSEDIGTLVLMFYWTINANAWKCSFWMLTYIVNDESLRKAILEELSPIVASTKPQSPIEMATKLSDCQCLNAVYNEVLRLTASSVSVRTVTGPAILGNLTLERGAKIVVPYRQMLLDERVFGSDAAIFNHQRFLDHPSLAKSSSFKPFGGGITLCPGRQLAQREVLTFVALAIYKFDVRMGKAQDCTHRAVPDLETEIPCIGIMGPVSGQDVHTSVRWK